MPSAEACNMVRVQRRVEMVGKNAYLLKQMHLDIETSFTRLRGREQICGGKACQTYGCH
jgi:hypothetical protein